MADRIIPGKWLRNRHRKSSEYLTTSLKAFARAMALTTKDEQSRAVNRTVARAWLNGKRVGLAVSHV